MVRDLELVRKLLTQIEDEPGGYGPIEFANGSYSSDEISYHLHLMGDAGLIELDELCSQRDRLSARECRLTWNGHEFLEATKSKPAWKATRTVLSKLGSANFDVAKSILTDQLKQAAAGL